MFFFYISINTKYATTMSPYNTCQSVFVISLNSDFYYKYIFDKQNKITALPHQSQYILYNRHFHAFCFNGIIFLLFYFSVKNIFYVMCTMYIVG